jgi:peptidoglycan/LPS O-acetylase OafA/YrhL
VNTSAVSSSAPALSAVKASSGKSFQGRGNVAREPRSQALDAVKGLLVVLMVLYHWLNYFVTRDGAVYTYLRFITPSFIFITGFLISNVYLTRYRVGERTLHQRLLIRGVKLLILFTVLNLAASLLVGANYDGSRLGVERFVVNAFSTFVKGGGEGVAFEVLVPIGYILVASSVCLFGCRVHPHFLLGLWLLGVGGVYALKWGGVGSSILELMTMGFLGMAIGRASLETIERAAQPVATWMGIYGIYLVTLTVYGVVYELQVVGLLVNMAVLYIVGSRLGGRGFVGRRVGVLGQYSLLAYVTHIVILQLLVRVMPGATLGIRRYVLSLGAAVVLTIISVEMTAWLRTHSSLADRLYRLVLA